jgi:Tfp pilus assembly protein PilX
MTRRRYAAAAPRRQQGVVLMVALIVLVALTLAGLSMVRSVDTGSVITGNIAFKQGATQSTDAAIEAAFTDINNTFIKVPNATVANKYVSSSNNLATNIYGVPCAAHSAPTTCETNPSTDVDWKNVPAAAVTTPTGYTVKYLVERMCTGDGTTPISDVAGKCFTERAAATGSKKAGSPVFTGAIKTNYRITVRVDGPRNTLTYAQSVVSF